MCPFSFRLQAGHLVFKSSGQLVGLRDRGDKNLLLVPACRTKLITMCLRCPLGECRQVSYFCT